MVTEVILELGITNLLTFPVNLCVSPYFYACILIWKRINKISARNHSESQDSMVKLQNQLYIGFHLRSNLRIPYCARAFTFKAWHVHGNSNARNPL